MEENKELSFGQKLTAPVEVLWEKHKPFLIGFGILILIIKFQDVIMDAIVGSSKKLVDNAEKKDAQLKGQQEQANNQANQLIKEAKDLENNKSSIDEDWHKK